MYTKSITLGIETSCDETGVSLYNNENGILSEYVYSQTVHNKYGGTVPELASRDHAERLLNLVIFTLKKANVGISDINCISYTKGPGLSGPLFVGSSFSKSLGLSISVPSIGINHLEAHLVTAFLFNSNIKFPCLAFLVSGAHTIILKLDNYKKFIFLGETLDDGAGEVFDKVARSLKLNPFNGLSVEKLSKCVYDFKNLRFPKSFYRSDCFNFSFSGLKTNVLNLISEKESNNNHFKANVAYNFQNTVIKLLLNKCKKILNIYDIKSILFSGGVSANKELRLEISNFALSLNLNCYFAPIRFCMDNGTMVAFLGFIKLLENCVDKDLSINVYPRIRL